jgi:type II secretory ATPase GspE/PulE/Tfp pilus assembly ATPase PilB-like protein
MRTSAGEALDMDMIAELMHGILAQQLARLLCVYCKAEDNCDDTREKMKLVSGFSNYDGHEIMAYKQGPGCDHCYGSGYRGRSLVYEILKFNRQVKDMVIGKSSLHDLRNMIPYEKQMSGRLLRMVSSGVTSMEEAYRIAEDL